MRDYFELVVAWVKRHKVWSVVIGLALSVVVFQLVKPTKHDYEYVTATAGRGEVVRRVTASGKLRALNTIKVGAEVSGQITRVFVDFNSPVHAGQVLAEIDPTRLRARVQQTQAQVALAEAGLAQAQANAARAQTDIGVQEREFARRKQLSDLGFVSKSAYDTAQSQLAGARAGTRSTAAAIASARAQISQSKAELSSAQLDLSRTTIIAPTSGVIINKLVESGTTVAASFQTPNLFEIAADTTRMQVEASVDEADIGQVRVGQDVSFSVDAYPQERFRAVVRQIRQAATETANVVSYLVILEVDNRNGKLLPGMTANVEIVTGTEANVLRVPTTSLRFRPKVADRPNGSAPPAGSQLVYVATADPFKPARRVVSVGLSGEDYVEIIKGLNTGDRVLVSSRSTIKKHETDEDDGGADNGT